MICLNAYYSFGSTWFWIFNNHKLIHQTQNISRKLDGGNWEGTLYNYLHDIKNVGEISEVDFEHLKI